MDAPTGRGEGDDGRARAPDPGTGRGDDGRARAPDPGAGDLDELTAEATLAARRVSGLVAGATLLVLHGLVGYLTLSLGLVAPPWAVALLLVAWAAIGAVAWRSRRQRPLLAMLAPFATVGLVLGVVALGDALLGWSA